MWEVHGQETPFNVHYVGHSRGAVVNSEANERLAYYEGSFDAIDAAVDSVQVTMLDAHPANNRVGRSVNPGYLHREVIRRLFESAAMDPDPAIWSNVDWADGYYQRTRALDAIGDDFKLNLWGYGPNAPPPWQSAPYHSQMGLHKDFTARRFERTSDGSPTPISHNTITDWYFSTVIANAAPATGSWPAAAGTTRRPGRAGHSAPSPSRPSATIRPNPLPSSTATFSTPAPA